MWRFHDDQTSLHDLQPAQALRYDPPFHISPRMLVKTALSQPPMIIARRTLTLRQGGCALGLRGGGFESLFKGLGGGVESDSEGEAREHS